MGPVSFQKQMNQHVIIRCAKPEESELLSDIAFRSKAYWGYSAEFMAACQGELTYSPETLKKHPFFLATEANAGGEIPLGFYGLVRVSETTIELEALFLDPKHIGRGIGRLLYEHALSEAKKSRAQRLTIQGDPHAKDFYLKVGAKLIDEKESGSIPGRFLPLFSVNLAAH